MLSEAPINIKAVKREDIDKEILRYGIIAEFDAINVYEQMADMTENEEVKKILLDVAKEEKVHVGEFQTLLLKMDAEQKRGLEEGREEVEELSR